MDKEIDKKKSEKGGGRYLGSDIYRQHVPSHRAAFPSPSPPTLRFSSASAKLRLLAPLPFPFPLHICVWISQRYGRLDWRINDVVLCFTMGYFAILPFFIVVIISPSSSFSSLSHCFLWSSMDRFFFFCRLVCWFVLLFVFPSAVVVLAIHPQLIAMLPP